MVDNLLSVAFGIIILLIILYAYLNSKYNTLFAHCQHLLKQRQGDNVRHGNAWEQFVPFASNFPFDRGQFKFLGKPVDGIVFGDDKISFVEIKTGESQLSASQKQVKKLVEEKRVEWKELRY